MAGYVWGATDSQPEDLDFILNFATISLEY
jgi:hypothetical protein